MQTRAPKRFFSRSLMAWHQTANLRTLPWKQERDPYRIWLSEVLLQQTRTQQGLPYYLRFTEAYPTIQDIAAADDEDVYRLWQGLGYYNRCKNMLATARYIINNLCGKFPDTYDGILALKGVGPYTAAAIASFAYGLPHAVVDGNVYRVLARYFGIDTPTDSTQGKHMFQALAQEVLNTCDSAEYNQAIMDLGATICTPAKPLCPECPLQTRCIALRQGMTGLLPIKSKKTAVRRRYFHYLLLHHKGKVWMQKRTGKDIWQNLYEPYLIEADTPLDRAALQQQPDYAALGLPASAIVTDEGLLKQKLTHQHLETRFFGIHLKSALKTLPKTGEWLSPEALKKKALPKTLVSFLEKNL